MAKAEWGTKRVCQGCGGKFYDLQRNPITCPSCGVKFDPEALLKSRRIRTAPVSPPRSTKPVVKAKVEAEVVAEAKAEAPKDDDEVAEDQGADIGVADDLDEGDDVIVDADELDADDDIEEVVGKKDDEES